MKTAAQAIKTKVPDVFPVGYTGLTEHMYLPTIWQAGGEIATQDGDTWKAALNSPQAAEAIDYYASFYKDGLAPKDAIGWEEPDAQTAFANGDIAMLVGGGWTYQAIIDTKPEMKDKIGTVLEPAGPSSNTAFAGGSHLVTFKESKSPELATAFVDFMLKPDELNKFTNGVGFLPGTTAGIESSGYLDDPIKKPFAEQLLDHSAVYPPSPRWGALEGANIFDGEIQKVMQGKQSGAGGRPVARDQDGRGVRRVSPAGGRRLLRQPDRPSRGGRHGGARRARVHRRAAHVHRERSRVLLRDDARDRRRARTRPVWRSRSARGACARCSAVRPRAASPPGIPRSGRCSTTAAARRAGARTTRACGSSCHGWIDAAIDTGADRIFCDEPHWVHPGALRARPGSAGAAGASTAASGSGASFRPS